MLPGHKAYMYWTNGGSRTKGTPFSSLANSIAAYQPMYAPPTPPERSIIQAGGSSFFQNGIPAQFIDQHTRMVSREPRMDGIRWLYSFGAQTKSWFREIATGQVERSKFQPITAHRWSGEFNDALYQAGYPRNLGYSFKVSQLPANMAIPGPSMQSKPWITKPYFSRRAYTSGVAPVALQSTYPPNAGG